MAQVIYGDVYFLINFSIDFLVLVLTGRFLQLRRRLWRLVSASLFGGVYAVLILLPALVWWQAMFLQMAAAVLMCRLAYGRIPAPLFLRLVMAFYGAALLLGGAINAFYALLASIFGTAGLDGTNAVLSERKAELFMLYAVISGLVFCVAGRILSRRTRVRSITVEIEDGGRRAVISGLVDSGNLLTDPLSGKAVIVAREEEVAPLLSFSTEAVLRGDGDIPAPLRRKMRILVARGIDGGRTMVGYMPDSILLYGEGEEKSKLAVDAIVAVYNGDTQDFSGYGAIVPASLVG